MNKKASGDNRRLVAFINRIHDLTPSQRDCLLYFKSLYIRHGARALHPSMATIAKRCRISERTARYAVRHLESRNFIRVVANEKGGNGKARHYAFIELSVLSAAYQEGGKIRQEIAPFMVQKKGAEIAPEKYTLEPCVASIAETATSTWASDKVRTLLEGCGA